MKLVLPPGVGVALAAALLFGASTPLAKLLLAHTSPWLLAALLYLGSGIGLALLRRVRKAPRVHLAPGEKGWLLGAILSGGIIAPVLLMTGLVHLHAAQTSLLVNAEGVFTALLAWFAFKENFDRRVALGMLAIIAGALVLSWPSGKENVTTAVNIWPTLAVLGACLAWAIDNNLTRKVSLTDASYIAMTKGLIAGFTNLLLALVMGATWPGLGTVSAGALLGFLSYGTSLMLFVLALRQLGTARTGAYFSVAPFLGALISVVFLKEPITVPLLVAGGLMVLGIWLHVTEAHVHEHIHDAMDHDHEHVHNDGHHDPNHQGHAGPVAPETRHSHPHHHPPVTHRHVHFPDAHHQHAH